MLFVCDLLFFRVGATLAVVPSPTINGGQGGRKPTALQVYRRDTPPGVSGPHHQQKDQVVIFAFPNALPRGEGGPRRGSGEEFGRTPTSQNNITDLHRSYH